MGVGSGAQDLVVAGGVEVHAARAGTWASATSTIDGANPALRERVPTVPQGISADLIATVEGFSRQDVDAFAVESQRRAAVAGGEGRFDPFPAAGDRRQRRGRCWPSTNTSDPEPRWRLWPSSAPPSPSSVPRRRVEGEDLSFDELCLARYPDLDHVEHVHHAGNSSGIVDGAAAALVASEGWVRAHGVTPRARVRSTAAVGSEPVIMLTAPGPAARRCLERAGMQTRDIDLWEINEAFAAVPLKTMRDLASNPTSSMSTGERSLWGIPSAPRAPC